MDEFIRSAQQFFGNKYFIATAIPLILIVVVGPIRKLTRGTKGYKQSDFYLGMDLALGAFTTNLVYVSEGMVQSSAAHASPPNFVPAITFATVILLLMFVIMSFHQDWESENARPKMRFFMLSILSNFLGAGLLLSFILFIKGI